MALTSNNSVEEYRLACRKRFAEDDLLHEKWKEADCYFSRGQRFTTLKIQAPEMCPIKVMEPFELLGVDLIGQLRETRAGNILICILP
ncbi:hypothetical protein Pcinc_019666 [Petrolisthes cinctipes]|uniref:Uncharacterized protein n=1 Tax=Petrolisthes cinctipes TaxID=88211 RepID=A0AAE1KK30_PETCI|nr:hypothetical protein Pcinc_019666 [Petrolisthes cinctipes]